MARLLIFFFCFHSILVAQRLPPVLQWQTHFSYHKINTIVAGGQNVVYAAGSNGILKIDLNAMQLERIDKNNDLSGVDIGAVAFNSTSKSLWVAYQNGNIDWITEDRVKRITDVLNFQTNQDKTFHDIQFSDGKVYLAGDLGVVVYDPGMEEIIAVYQNLGESGMSLTVNALQFGEDIIYLATSDGILSAPTNTPLNLQDFNNWERQLTGLSFHHITQSDGKLWAASEGDVFALASSGSWEFQVHFKKDVHNFTAGSEQEVGYLVLPDEIRILNDDFSLFASANEVQSFHSFLALEPFHLIGTDEHGLLQFDFMQSQAKQQWLPSGPLLPIMFHQQSTSIGSFWVKHTFDSLNQLTQNSVLSRFVQKERAWQTIPISFEGIPLEQVTGVLTANSSLENFFASSFTQGVFEKTPEGINSLMQSRGNSPLPDPNGSYQVSGMAYQDNKLWIAFYNRSEALYSFDLTARNWERHNLNHPIRTFVKHVFIAPNGDKWLRVDETGGGGILVYNEVSGRERYLNSNGGQGGLPNRKVQALATDKQGQVWIGTASGIAYLPSLNRILEGAAITASVPIFESRLLLQNESITAIAIDPANRKWLGTEQNGLWLFSEKGEELVFHFTSENSPLPSNRVLSLGLHEETGELFITTDKGVVSFRTDASLGNETHQDVKVYPNPVRPGFRGRVVIEGLVNNAELKITDVSGKLVAEIRANGGTATWNQRDINGSRVSTGVYLLFSSNAEGTETLVTQIVVI